MWKYLRNAAQMFTQRKKAWFQCVCERERERQGHINVKSAFLITACLQIYTSIITVSVTRLCSPLGFELMVKLRTLLTVFIFTLKAEARDYGKG